MKFKPLVSAILATGIVFMGANAQSAQALTNQQTKQVKSIIEDYISNHPEAIIASLQSYQQKQMSRVIQQTQAGSLKEVEGIFKQSDDPSAGNPNGKVTVVEFFDYQCGHCVNMQKVLEELVKNNSDVKVVFKEFPIRGPVSEKAAKAALAAHKQGKYVPFHEAIMAEASKKPLTEEIIFTTAGTVGLDVEQLKTDMKSEEVDKQLKKNFKLAQKLEIMGTPAIFVAPSNVTTKSPAADVVFIAGETDKESLDKTVQQLSK